MYYLQEEIKMAIKKSKMDPETTYLLCPDPSCNLFAKPTGMIPCEYECPHQDKLRKIILCPSCKDELIDLPGDHNLMQRIDHTCSSTGKAPFILRNGPHEIIYEMPE
jgi:hypothetical protein